jgi:predicted AAA+ superfamily ATPase
MINRKIETKIEQYLKSDDNKILFIWGPRRSGKTTILNKISKEYDIRIFNFDFIDDRELFKPSREALEKIVNTTQIILIDEVQNCPEATTALKLLHDEYKVKIIATGSSELRQTTNDFDTLAGRFLEYYCLPLSFDEVIDYLNPNELDLPRYANTQLHKQLIYGSYPEVYLSEKNEDSKQDLLNNIINTYVLKDVVSIYNLKDLKLAKEILTKISLQLGSEVSLREIATSLQANVTTVSNYIEIFVKNYILISLPSFKTNARRAVSENKKYYFYDLGIRNALIKDFRELELRQDKGAVFENYILSEIEKIKKYVDYNFSTYFYREYHGKEVDLVIENYKKEYKVYDIKLQKDVKDVNVIFPLEHKLNVINTSNYFEKLKELL